MQNNECIRAKWKGKSMDVFQAVIAVYLLILSVIDIRWKKVSVRSLLILLAIAVLCQVLCSKGELRMMVAGGLCGGVFLFLVGSHKSHLVTEIAY